MKKTYLIFACVALAFSNSINAQSVSTVPVGYTTVTINGSPDGSVPAFTAVSAGLQNEALYRGSITSDANSAVLTDSNANNTANAYAATDAAGNPSYFVQIISGANEGLILDIVANNANTYTTGSDLTGLVSSGDRYAIKAYLTLSDVFGANNEAGLTSGGDPSNSDLIYLMSTDGAASYATYYYQTDTLGFLGGDGWRVVGNSNTDMSNVVVAPDDGLMVRRISAGDLSVVVSGSVNVAKHSRDLPAGFSLVAYPFPVDVTLGDSGIYTSSNGYVSGGDSSNSDVVYIIGSDGIFKSYYYQTDSLGFLGGNGWRLVGDTNTDVADTVISRNSSVIVLHRGNGLAWRDAVPFSF